MNSHYNLLLNAICILVFAKIAFTSDLITCKLPHQLSLQLSNNQRAILDELDLTVRVKNESMSLTSYKGTNSLNIQANNVVVNFNGIMYIESDDPTQKVSTEPQILSRTYIDRISGIAKREVLDSSVIELPFDGCRIVLLSNEMDRPGMSGRIANEIRRFAESCIELELCQKVGKIRPQFMATPPVNNVSDLMFACPDPLVIATNGCEEFYDTDTVQPVTNKAVDVALDEISANLKALNGGTISIPDVNQKFSTGSSIFKTNGYFKAVNGTFRDLTTIRRLSDVSLSHDGMKMNAACKFGLKIADLNYPHYEVKYGIIKVNGKLSGSVKNTALVIRVAVDYNRKPCRITMEYLKVTELGDMKIQLTGLGPLNWMVSKLLNWVTITWREEIVVTLEKELLASVQEKLSSFNCEKYRP